MKHVYYSLTPMLFGSKPCVLAHLTSPLDRNALERLAEELEVRDRLDTASPPYPWKEAEVVILYHGLDPFPTYCTVRMPGGKTASVQNVNPEHYDCMPDVLKAYVDVIEALRQSLLKGCSKIEAAAAAWLAASNSEILKHHNYSMEFFFEEAEAWKEMMVEWGYLKS